MTKYARRTALVAGEATGIGLAIAKRLVEGGASVLLTARTDEERAHAVAELGSAARVVTPSAVEADTGGVPGSPGLPGFPDGVELLFADAVATARPLLPYLRDGGAIVLTAPTACPDAVTALAAELAARGIRVNAVAPGCIEAPGSGAVPLPPLGRLGAAEEVARAALFLATEATFTTGARLPVDGGLGHP
ncbi:SDR family oxidoreductase [Streptomyces griseus]|uniref:SDR family oxidoreductase n=1 Tax=Streptomyces stephensoniae TaxID=3375367 RepID=A0ABU2WE84_9ACTN|nr:SDR family oxidoreductase [Streptomyces griseus]MDT0495402.1 SDR family oxidoreductase [Streptomyces griseus]